MCKSLRLSIFFAVAMSAAFLNERVAAQTLRLASLDQYTLAAVEPGDRMTVLRPFNDNWTLRCELSVSLNRRLCSVEQTVEGAGGGLFWRLGQTGDGRSVLIFSLPPNMAPASGLKLQFGSVQATIHGWQCSPRACLATSLLLKPLQGLLLDGGQVDLLYETRSGQAVRLSSSLGGLQKALDAAAKDPFAKQPQPRKQVIPVPKPRPELSSIGFQSEVHKERGPK